MKKHMKELFSIFLITTIVLGELAPIHANNQNIEIKYEENEDVTITKDTEKEVLTEEEKLQESDKLDIENKDNKIEKDNEEETNEIEEDLYTNDSEDILYDENSTDVWKDGDELPAEWFEYQTANSELGQGVAIIDFTPIKSEKYTNFKLDLENGKITKFSLPTKDTEGNNVIEIPDSRSSSGSSTVNPNEDPYYHFNSSFKDLTKISKANLTISIPKSMKKLGSYSFRGLQKVNTIQLNNSLEFIGKEAFSLSSLKYVEIPGSVKTIGHSAFLNCANLENIKLNEGLLKIDKFALQQTAITNLELPSTVEIIDEGVFSSCENLDAVKLNEGLKEIGSRAFEFSNIKKIEIPSTVKTIKHRAFLSASNLTSILLNNDIETIGNYAFQGTSITSLELPKSLANTGTQLFYNTHIVSDLIILGAKEDRINWDEYFLDNISPTIISYESNKGDFSEYPFKNFITIKEEIIVPINGYRYLTFENNDINLRNIDKIDYVIQGDVLKGGSQSGSISGKDIKENMKIKFEIDESKDHTKLHDINVKFSNSMKYDILDEYTSSNIKVYIPEQLECPSIPPTSPEGPETTPPLLPETPVEPELKPEKPEKPGIETEEDTEYHHSYITGYPDQTVRAQNNVTREESAAMLYRALEMEGSGEHNYPDIPKGKWSESYIGRLTTSDVFEGYTDGTFRPSKGMTRGEFAATIARFRKLDKVNENHFEDTKGHWSEGYVNALAKAGLVQGFEGKFKPQQLITRAEMITMINNAIDRNLKIDELQKINNPFRDLNKNLWYYEAIIEASLNHDFIIKDNTEFWTD